MSSDTTPTTEDTTENAPAKELQRLLEELKTSTVPLAKMLRKKLQGNDVDVAAARQEAVSILDSVIEQVSPARQRGPQSYTPAELIDDYWNQIAERREGATTGFVSLNKALGGGLEQNTLVVLLGAPGSGKSTLTNQIADHVASIKRPVLYVTSEDTPGRLLAKTIARIGNIEYNAVKNGWPNEKDRIEETLQQYKTMVSAGYIRYVDATQGITLDAIYELAQAHFSRLAPVAKGAPVLVIDYLQRLSRFENLGGDPRQSASVYTDRVRAMANELHCTSIMLSAMTRASGYSAGNSTIAAAKESGDIEYTADVIMALGPQEDAQDPAPGHKSWMLRLDKNRQGEVTSNKHISLDWYGSRQHFTEMGQMDGSQAAASRASSSNGRKR